MTDITESYVTVLPSVKASGWNGKEGESIKLYPVMSLREFLETEFDYDAMGVQYTWSVSTEYCTRVNKGAIKDPDTGALQPLEHPHTGEAIDHAMLNYSCMFFDVDDDSEGGLKEIRGKVSADEYADKRDEYMTAEMDKLLGLDQYLLDSMIFYGTSGGYRIGWRTPDMPPAEWRAYRDSLKGVLADEGIEIDDNADDDQRLFRAPRAKRTYKDGRVETLDYERFYENYDTLLDVSMLPAPAVPVQSTKDINNSSIFANIHKAVTEFKKKKSFAPGEMIPKGKRNAEMYKWACADRDRGFDATEIFLRCWITCQTRMDNPLDDSELWSIVNSAMKHTPSYCANEAPPVAVTTDDALRFGSENDLAKWLVHRIQQNGVQLMGDQGSLWRYDPEKGLWSKYTDGALKRFMSKLEGHIKIKGPKNKQGQDTYKPLRITKKLAENAHSLMADFCSEDGAVTSFFDSAPFGLAYANGFVAIDDQGNITFEPLSPEHRQTHRLEFDWNPNATCPQYDKYLSEVVDAQDGQTIKEWYGMALIGRSTKYEQAMMLTGTGANGKSVCLKIGEAAFPEGSIQSIPPQGFDSEYNLAKLRDCKLNSNSETPSADVEKLQKFKACVSGDRIMGRVIREMPTSFSPRAGHIFAANELPYVNDQTHGFWRKMTVIEFLRTFTPDQQDKTLAKRIIDQELQGVTVAMVKAAAEAVKRGHYLESDRAKAAKAKWRREADKVAMWIDEACLPAGLGDKDCYTGADAFQAFTHWCKASEMMPLSKPKFGRRLAKLVPKKRTSDHVLYGIKRKPRSYEQTVTITQLNPIH